MTGVTLKFTFQPAKSLPELNKQVNEFIELVKSELLDVATKEDIEGIQVETESNIKESTKGYATVRSLANDVESKVDMIATFNKSTAQISLKSAMIDGIERSDITLSGDQITLNGDTTIGSGFVLRAENISLSDLSELGASMAGFSISSNSIVGVNDNQAFQLKPGGFSFTDRATGDMMIIAPIHPVSGVYALSMGNLYVPSVYFSTGTKLYKTTTPDNDDAIYVSPNIKTGKIHADRGYFGKLQTTDTETTTTYDAALTTTGYIRRKGGSSKRFKNSISYELSEDMNPEKLYDVSIVSFKYNKDYLSKDDQRYDKHLIGFIAEDIDVHYPQACDYDDEGRPSGWNTHYIIPAMLKLIQDQKKEIDNLKERIEKLEEVQNGKD